MKRSYGISRKSLVVFLVLALLAGCGGPIYRGFPHGSVHLRSAPSLPPDELVDVLGFGHKRWKPATVLQAVPADKGLGVFYDTFGDVMPKLRTLFSQRCYPFIRIHMHWDNNHRLIPLRKLNTALPRVENFAKEFPCTKVYVSHSCEYNDKNSAEIKKRVDQIRALAPSTTPVNAVWRGPTPGGAVIEHHGNITVNAGEIVSTDGISSYDINAEAYNVRNHAALYRGHWGLRFNLREIPDPGQTVPGPKERTAVPSVQYIRSVVRLGEPKGIAPQPEFTSPVIALKAPNLYKTHAEDMQGVADLRENRPVLIIVPKASKVAIITKTGEQIGVLTYGGTFGSNQHRYYAGGKGAVGLYGYEIGEKARARSGSEFVWFKVGKKIFGPVNPAFRWPTFRNS